MKVSKALLLVVIMFSMTHKTAAQGPWAKGKGHGYGQFLFNFIPTYSDLFDKDNPEGTRQSERELSDVTLESYLEFGLSDKFTIGGTIPFVFVGAGAPSEETITPVFPEDKLASLGNISLWGKYSLIDKKWKLAFIADFSLPTSSRNTASGLATGVDAFTFQPKLSLGSSTAKFYYYAFFGYGLRSNEYHDFLSLGVEGGYKASEKITLILHLNRWHNLNNGNPAVDSLANIETGFYTSFQEYTSFLIKVFAEKVYKNFGAFGSLGGGGFTAKSVAASPALGFGIFYKW